MSILKSLKVKLYSDGADKTSMLEMAKNPNVAGITTNPTLMRKAGVTDYRSFCKGILAEIRDKPISFEVFADTLPEMQRQAMEIASWGSNVYVKIPVTNSEGKSTAALVHELSHAAVKLNVTAVFTVAQGWEVIQALAGGAPAVLSVFAGRIADAGVDPSPIMLACRELCQTSKSKIELLWASTRELYNIVQADQCGCDIITVSPDLLKKVSSFGKDLTEFSLDTVKMFKSDSEAAGFKL